MRIGALLLLTFVLALAAPAKCDEPSALDHLEEANRSYQEEKSTWPFSP